MPEFKSNFQKFKKPLQIAAILTLVLLAAFLLWFGNRNSLQAGATVRIDLYFSGRYCIDDGPWIIYREGDHIPTTKGDVILQGNFYKRYEGEDLGIYNKEDMPIAFYTNHINLTFCQINELGEKEYFVVDNENPLFGYSNCGKSWTAHHFTSEAHDPIEIIISNPHAFGNETAIDEMLAGLTMWSGIDFEKSALDSGDAERSIGLLFIIVSIMLLGIALFSALIHIKNTQIIRMLGFVVLFAGTYFAYGADGVSFWSDSIVTNTILLGASIMLYMFCVSTIIVYILEKTRAVGNLAVLLLIVANAIFFIIPTVSDVLFYDLLAWWVSVQMVANAVLVGCLIKELLISKTNMRWLYAGAFLPLVAFAADVIGIFGGSWKDGIVSQAVFTALFVVAIVMVLKLIPQNINAANKARELELEKTTLNAALAESRISTMMSQIRPHFIYNTLGSIEQLCKIDPMKAGELVHNFAKYLRGNFGELDNIKPILMSQEMEHVHHYISIENVRFPDMTFSFEMNSDDFHIPALTVQPIVENAIKHGLMKLPRGGTIRVVSYQTDTDYCISVVDDGVGFDTGALLDDRKHVGIRNIRERLKVMVNGTLKIESAIGVGTRVDIIIPKEVRK